MIKTLLFVLAVQAGQDWQQVAGAARESIVLVSDAANDESACTGFVIDAEAKGGRDLILTAAHCDGAVLLADDQPAVIVWKNAKVDLMVLSVEDTGRPALRLAAKDPAVGQRVASWGYGYGLGRPMFRTAHVADEKAAYPNTEGGPFIMIDAPYVGGQSGGPCLNDAGEVVSIVQRKTGEIGLGVGAEAIRARVGKYFGRTK